MAQKIQINKYLNYGKVLQNYYSYNQQHIYIILLFRISNMNKQSRNAKKGKVSPTQLSPVNFDASF